MKRRMHGHDQNETREQQQLFLQRLSTELNNVGASLQEVGENVMAMKLHRSAASTALESLEGRGDLRVERKSIQGRLVQIMRGRQILETLRRTSQATAQHPQELCGESGFYRTWFLPHPLKIDKAIQKIKPTTEEENTSAFKDGTASAIILHNLGLICYSRGSGERATKIFERAIDIVSEEGGDYPYGSLVFPILFNNLGHLYYRTGKRHKAAAAFSESWRLGQEVVYAVGSEFEVARAQGSPDEQTSEDKLVHKYAASIWYNKGLILTSQADYDGAMECWIESWTHVVTPSLSVRIIANMNRIGRLHHNHKNYQEALRVYRQALETSGAMSKKLDVLGVKAYSLILHDMGMTYYAMGSYKNARRSYLRSLRLLRLLFGEDNRLVIWVKNKVKLALRMERLDDDPAAPAA